MVPVIGRVDILAIPAGREVDLGTDAASAGSRRQVVRLWARFLVGSEAAEDDGARVIDRRVVGAEEGVTGDHAEALHGY
jgi:hypothetical protein